MDSSMLPTGYQIKKDMVLDLWHILVDGSILNQYDDKPWLFTSEQRAIAFCEWHNTIKHLVIDGLECEGGHHKQHYLWKIADVLDLDATQIYAEEETP